MPETWSFVAWPEVGDDGVCADVMPLAGGPVGTVGGYAAEELVGWCPEC